MRASARITALDATRGIAMFAACVSHFSRVIGDRSPSVGELCVIFGLEATPAFLLLSGVVIGYLSTLRRESDLEFRIRLFDRGLFLLVVAHFAIGISQVGWHSSLYSVFLTDAIGVAMCVMGLIGRSVTAKRLASFGISLYVVCWCIGAMWVPDTRFASLFGLIVFGVHEHGAFTDRYVVPVLPYLGLFLVGVAIGKTIAPLLALETAARRLGRYCISIGMVLMMCAIAVRFAWSYIEPNVSGSLAHALKWTMAPEQKLPPSPTYLLFFGGAALVASGLSFYATSVVSLERYVEVAAVVGRSSLFVFVLQYWLYYMFPQWINVDIAYIWIWWLPLSLAVLWLAAWAWDRANGNRWVTIGLRALVGNRPMIRA